MDVLMWLLNLLQQRGTWLKQKLMNSELVFIIIMSVKEYYCYTFLNLGYVMHSFCGTCNPDSYIIIIIIYYYLNFTV